MILHEDGSVKDAYRGEFFLQSREGDFKGWILSKIISDEDLEIRELTILTMDQIGQALKEYKGNNDITKRILAFVEEVQQEFVTEDINDACTLLEESISYGDTKFRFAVIDFNGSTDKDDELYNRVHKSDIRLIPHSDIEIGTEDVNIYPVTHIS